MLHLTGNPLVLRVLMLPYLQVGCFLEFNDHNLAHSLMLFCILERSQSQDPVPCRFIEKVWYDIYHLFVSYQLTRNSR